MKNAVISIIIPFYGSKTDLQNCLAGINNQKFTEPFEIIVLESGNNPEVKKEVSKITNATLISSDKVMCPGLARNLGVKLSSSSILAFTDADCVPDVNWLSEIYSSLQKYDVVIGPVLNLYPFHPFASVDNLLQFVDFQKYRKSKISHFPACNVGLRKEIFFQTNGFPEDMETGEDIIFSEAVINNSGAMILFNKKLTVKHSGRKEFLPFIKHNIQLGFYRGYYNLKIKSIMKPQQSLILYSLYFGIRRLLYITLKTFQWNPIGALRLFIYFPLFIIGLSSWVKGFYDGNREHTFKETFSIVETQQEKK